MLVAAAAMALASCQREELNAPKETVSATLTMHAGVDQTKTYIDQDNKVLWGTGESVKLYVGAGEDATFVSSTETDAYEGAETASFTFAIDGVAESDSYSLGGVYPASAVVSTSNTKPESYKVQLPATQQSVAGNYDPSAYIMVLKPELVEELHTEYQASFRRATALNKITLTNVAEDINSVEITVPEKKYLAGRRNIDLTTGESGEIYDSGTQTNTVKVTGDFKAGSVDIWFCSWGVELEGGETMTIKMTSANNIYTRSITVREEGIKFVEGDLNKLAVNMVSAEVEALSNITGEYLIASKASSGWFLMTSTNEGKFYAATASVSSATEVTCADFYGVTDVENYVWDVAKYDTGYSIKNTSTNKYVAYDGSSNEAYANSDLDVKAKMDIKLDGQSAVIESMNVVGRKLKYNASSPRFAFYTTDQTAVYMIPWTPDTTPRVIAETKEFNVSAAETTVEIPYTVKNITGAIAATVADGATMTNVNATVADAKVTVTFDANTESVEKTATIVLSYEGAESANVIITQAAKPAEGAPEEVIDVLTLTTTGVTGTNYSDWSGKTVTSSAVYAGQSAGDKSSIQLRSKNNNSGVVTTASGGYARKIVVKWQSDTQSGRTLEIYGKNTAYTAATDLYDSTKQGTKLGSIKCGTSTELAIAGDYQYIGLRSADGAMYLSEIAITWSSEAGSGETPAVPVKLAMSDITCSVQTESSLTFTWSSVENAIGYEVTCNNKTETVTTTQYEVTGLTASTSYTVSIVAKGDGINYTDSESRTQTGKTKDAQQPGGGDEGDDQGGTEYVKVTSATPGPGTYLYVLDKGYVFTGDVSDNSWGISASVTISNEKIIATEELDAYAITLEEGSTSGQYAVKLPNGKYLQTSTSKPSSNTTKKYMTYDLIEGLRSVENSDYYFHANASSGNKFRWYKLSSNQVAGQLYKLN